MLASGTQIQVTHEGAIKCIEDLSIKDCIYCPFSRCDVKITNVLSKRIKIGDHEKFSLVPYVIPEGFVSDNHPNRAVVVSPKQQIMLIKKSDTNRVAPPKLQAFSAESVFQKFDSDLAEIEYHALFLDSPRPVIANGIVCLSYASSILFDPKRGQRQDPSLLAVRQADG